jgi:hypothetical protein
MPRNVLDILRRVRPVGPNGFEGLIANLLQALTGTRFHLASAGYQEGRDMSSRPVGGNVTAVECKRYGAGKLSLRELQGELVQVELAVPDLDVWVLVSSRDLDSKLVEGLQALAVEKGHAVLTISSSDGDPSSLEALVSSSPDVTANHPAIRGVATSYEIRSLLEEIAERPNFSARISALKDAFTSPLVGYANWRIQQNQTFLQTLKSEQQAQASYGQPIHVEDPQVKVIRRDGLWTALDQWNKDWSRDHTFAVLGEEGDGKTWGVTSWVADRVKHIEDFPGVIFLSSGGIYETEFTSEGLNPLFSRVIKERLRGITNDQAERRLSRWTSRKSQLPLFLVVLDGTNERRSPSLWRGLLEQLGGEPWSTYVRVLITCRTAYWSRHFEGLSLIPAKTFTLGPFDDVELNAVLARHNLRREEIPISVLPLIRKPRYFDLMVKHYKRVAESGDMTVARLIYEDWRDRYRRKRSISLSDEDFQNVIRGLVNTQTAKSFELSGAEIKYALPPDLPDQEEVIREFQTGGILRPDKNRFRVDEKLLVYGFGLLLVDQLEKASLAPEDPPEAIAGWLEPHADMDIKAAICEHAVLHALPSNTLSLEFKVALFAAWISNHNQTETAETTLTAYLPICPQAYVSLAEVVWSKAHDIRWVQEILTRAFIKWYESPQVASVLQEAFERWLGFIHVSGSAFQRDHARLREVQQEMASRVGHDVALESFDFAGYTFTGIDDDGHLRLSRVALAVISHLPRQSFVRAFVIGCLTEVITGTSNRHELLAWVFRTSEHDLWSDLKESIDQLLQTDNAVTRRAARRLLLFEGSQQAERLLKEIPTETTAGNAYRELHRQDPCTSGMAWTAEEAFTCVKRGDLDPRWVAQRIAEHCINPDLKVSEALILRFRDLPGDIDIDEMWVVMGPTGADHTFKTYEPVLAAFVPDVAADVVRAVVRQIVDREGMKRRQVSLRLEEHQLILCEAELKSIQTTWQQLASNPRTWGEADRVAEMCLFKEVLLQSDGDEQLRNLLGRPERAADLVDYEDRFLPVSDWNSVEGMLSNPKDANALRRTLWFLSVNPKAIPARLMTEFIVLLINHEDSHVRSKACQLIYQTSDDSGIAELIRSNWHWNPSDDSFQNHWASLILSECGTMLPFNELCRRLHPTFWGYAVARRGNKAEEVFECAEMLEQLLRRIGLNTAELPADLPPFTIESKTDAEIQDISHRTLPSELFNRSISFMNFSSTRGGIAGSDDFRPEDFDESALEDQTERLREIVHDSIDQQHSAGNILFGQEFHTYGLDQIVNQRPDLVTGWLSRIDPNTREGRAFISRASSFCDALCTVLLREQVEAGIELYWKLQESLTRIRVIDHYTQVDLLDFALFDVTASESIMRAWQRKLEESYSDAELLRVAMLAQHGNGGEWLWSYTSERSNSSLPIDKARSRVILGFIERPEAFASIERLLETDPDTWVRRLAQKSKERQDKNIWAKHWFQRSLIRENDISAWGAFRLFLRSVDTRFWFWRATTENETDLAKVTQRRRDFLNNNMDNVRNSIRNNERELTNQFLGQKIMKQQVWPWM